MAGMSCFLETSSTTTVFLSASPKRLPVSVRLDLFSLQQRGQFSEHELLQSLHADYWSKCIRQDSLYETIEHYRVSRPFGLFCPCLLRLDTPGRFDRVRGQD